ncbi:MAG: ComF family protein [Bdellovibrionia bacterium]
MIPYLTQCMGCKQVIDRFFSVLCAICEQSLVKCPPLCASCASPLCLIQPHSTCLRPWIKRLSCPTSTLDSTSARYLLVGKGYEVLKNWKKRGGLFFDRKVLVSDPELISQWMNLSAQAIVPIPQTHDRSWQMGKQFAGTPVQRIARWVSIRCQIPVVPLLEKKTRIKQAKRQAQMTFQERISNRENPFQWAQNLTTEKGGSNDKKDVPQSVLLVDDFMTTGQTLREAAHVLKSSGVRQVHAFCLGARVFRGRRTRENR